MIMVTTSELPGMTVKEVKGLVQGNTIRARNVGRDIMAGLRNLVGGEITEYTRLMTESRAQATQRMVDEAEKLGANTILGCALYHIDGHCRRRGTAGVRHGRRRRGVLVERAPYPSSSSIRRRKRCLPKATPAKKTVATSAIAGPDGRSA